MNVDLGRRIDTSDVSIDVAVMPPVGALWAMTEMSEMYILGVMTSVDVRFVLLGLFGRHFLNGRRIADVVVTSHLVDTFE